MNPEVARTIFKSVPATGTGTVIGATPYEKLIADHKKQIDENNKKRDSFESNPPSPTVKKGWLDNLLETFQNLFQDTHQGIRDYRAGRTEIDLFGPSEAYINRFEEQGVRHWSEYMLEVPAAYVTSYVTAPVVRSFQPDGVMYNAGVWVNNNVGVPITDHALRPFDDFCGNFFSQTIPGWFSGSSEASEPVGGAVQGIAQSVATVANDATKEAKDANTMNNDPKNTTLNPSGNNRAAVEGAAANKMNNDPNNK